MLGKIMISGAKPHGKRAARRPGFKLCPQCGGWRCARKSRTIRVAMNRGVGVPGAYRMNRYRAGTKFQFAVMSSIRLLCLLVLCSPNAFAAETRDLILVAGQSNAV